MSLFGSGLVNVGGNIDNQTMKKIDRVFSMLDEKIGQFSKARGLFPAQVRLLQPVHCCVFVGDIEILVAVAVHEVGGGSIRQYKDWSGKQLNIQQAIFLVERDLSFKNAFGLKFMRSVLDSDDAGKEAEVTRIATQYVNEEIANLERLSRIVRINPIFHGRNFLINEQMVFVLSPFAEPFDTIYSDHIKSLIEGIEGFQCLRADSIYDNRPVIEDIWRYTNEARIVISELTGRNPNVFYETGIAHTIGKEVVLITQSMDEVPFDLRHLRCIVYEYTPRGMSLFEDNLKNTISNILARRS